MTSPTRSTVDPLEIAAIEIERHVAHAGWDQPWRLFALVDAAEFAAVEPALANAKLPGELTAVEQEDLPAANGVEALLAQIAWPAQVHGVALAIERVVIPPEAETTLPPDAEAALTVIANHPQRAEVRLLAAVHRDGRQVTLLRQRAHDADDQVATGEIAPGLISGLRATLQD